MSKILLIGDTSGRPDEGMKKIANKLSCLLCSNNDINVAFVSVPESLRNPHSFGKVDIIHYMSGPSWRSFFYAYLLKRLTGNNAKTIISFIHPHWSVPAGVFFRVFKPDAVIVQTEKWKRYCSNAGVLISDELLAGVDFKKFRPVSEEERMHIRSKLGLPTNKKILLHVGHLNLGRNLLPITRFRNDEDIFPVVVGSTTVRPHDKVVTALKQAGVKVIREYMENIEQLYQTADCYLFPTIDPRCCVQIPLSVLEALACGVHTVATRFEGLSHFLPDGFPGLTYIDDPAAICKIVRHAIYSDVKPDPMRLQEFSWDRIAVKISAFYQRLLAA